MKEAFTFDISKVNSVRVYITVPSEIKKLVACRCVVENVSEHNWKDFKKTLTNLQKNKLIT